MAGLISKSAPGNEKSTWQQKCLSYLESAFKIGKLDDGMDWAYYVNTGSEFSELRSTEKFVEIVEVASRRRLKKFVSEGNVDGMAAMAKSLDRLNETSGRLDLVAVLCYAHIAMKLDENLFVEYATNDCSQSLSVVRSKMGEDFASRTVAEDVKVFQRLAKRPDLEMTGLFD